MSIQAIDYFRSVRFGDRYPSRKLLMILLADRADEEFSCFPSIGLLADEMETDRRAIQRHIKSLSEDGYLSVESRSRGNKSTSSNRYYLHGPWDEWAGTDGKPFEVIAPRRSAPLVREGNFRPRKKDQAPDPSPGIFPQDEGGGHETAGGAVTEPQGGGHGTAGGAVAGPPLEPSVNPQMNPHPEHPLPASGGEAVLSDGESVSGGLPFDLLHDLFPYAVPPREGVQEEVAEKAQQQEGQPEVINLPGGGALIQGEVVGHSHGSPGKPQEPQGKPAGHVAGCGCFLCRPGRETPTYGFSDAHQQNDYDNKDEGDQW